MRRLFSLSSALVFAIAVMAACNSLDKNSGASGSGKAGAASSTPNVGSDGVRRITTVELRDDLAQGTAIVIDTRPADSYKQSHIKGSISMPLDQVPNRIRELPRDKMIVTYCS